MALMLTTRHRKVLSGLFSFVVLLCPASHVAHRVLLEPSPGRVGMRVENHDRYQIAGQELDDLCKTLQFLGFCPERTGCLFEDGPALVNAALFLFRMYAASRPVSDDSVVAFFIVWFTEAKHIL